ncbi:hypothetical protein [Rhizobium terrae]|uniref:hypothetical protein n=1 Tax=Rhizobium terrae TaxID=2171756 RepID=UPI0013C35B7A|nr:hypothetical protein [Rhizobium terrae]
MNQVPSIIKCAEGVAPNIDQVQMVSSGTGYSFMQEVLLRWINAEARDLRGYAFMSAEYAIAPPKSTGDRTLLITTSVSGTTEDALLALAAVKGRVRHTVAFIGKDQSSIAENSPTVYTAAGAIDPYVANCLQMLVFIGKLLEIKEGWGGMPQLLASLPHFAAACDAAGRNSDEQAKCDAARFKDNDKMMFAAAGFAQQASFVIADCNMTEKLGVTTMSVEAARFMHGPQELVPRGITVILVLGEDKYQPLMGPVQKLCADHGKENMAVYSTRDMEMPGIAEKMRGLLGPLVLRTALKRFVSHLAEANQKDLDFRYLYGKTSYTVAEHGGFNLPEAGGAGFLGKT